MNLFKTKLRTAWIAGAIFMLPFAQLAADGHEPASVPDKLGLCITCHGEDGQALDPQWPNLGGQNAAYLAIQLRSFQDNTRPSEVMSPLVSTLGEEEIEELASWYGSQSMMAADSDAALAASGAHLAGYCVTCHGLNGITVIAEWPNIAGQQAEYIASRLRAFRSGESQNPSMAALIAAFSDEDIEAVAAYYSQFKGR